MNTADDTALAFTKSIIVHELELGLKIWKYKIGNRYGYYVATEQMTIEMVQKAGCPYPKLNEEGAITSFNDAMLFARDRIRWARKFIEMSSIENPIVTVFNGAIMVGDTAPLLRNPMESTIGF